MPMRYALFLILATTWAGTAAAQASGHFSPSYLPPADLLSVMGAHESGSTGVLEWTAAGTTHRVEIRRNDSANLVVFSGTADDVAAATALAKEFDIAPRQIELEARVVEVDTDRAQRLGIDWNRLNVGGFATWNADYQNQTQKVSNESGGFSSGGKAHMVNRATRGLANAQASLSTTFELLESEGAATSRDAPRVVTLNNREATILDGSRVTYVTRYSAYSNLYETQSMDAGLRLRVTPSLLESGLMRLDLEAELTSLGMDVSGSPTKRGQIVRNTIMARDGQTVLLGGFSRASDSKDSRRFPFLGRVLPFLFSREGESHERHETFLVLTAHTLDPSAGLDEATKKAVEGR